MSEPSELLDALNSAVEAGDETLFLNALKAFALGTPSASEQLTGAYIVLHAVHSKVIVSKRG